MTDNDFIIIVAVVIFVFIIYQKNKKKDNKWADSAVGKNKIIDHLNNYKLTKHMYKKFDEKPQPEVEWNKHLEESFKKSFLSVQRGNRSKKGEIDLNIGRGRCGLELKWAKSLKSTGGSDRARSQLKRYQEGKEYRIIILVVAGFSNEKHEVYLQDIEKWADNQDITYYFMEIS